MLKVLFVCTHNSARSQIAEALLSEKGKGRIIAYSAGTEPAEEINPLAVEAMREIGIDISEKKPKSIENFLQESLLQPLSISQFLWPPEMLNTDLNP
jgi:arsenate reductase